jgi:hypothetical protein
MREGALSPSAPFMRRGALATVALLHASRSGALPAARAEHRLAVRAGESLAAIVPETSLRRWVTQAR